MGSDKYKTGRRADNRYSEFNGKRVIVHLTQKENVSPRIQSELTRIYKHRDPLSRHLMSINAIQSFCLRTASLRPCLPCLFNDRNPSLVEMPDDRMASEPAFLGPRDRPSKSNLPRLHALSGFTSSLPSNPSHQGNVWNLSYHSASGLSFSSLNISHS